MSPKSFVMRERDVFTWQRAGSYVGECLEFNALCLEGSRGKTSSPVRRTWPSNHGLRSDFKMRACGSKAGRQRLPLSHGQDGPEVPHPGTRCPSTSLVLRVAALVGGDKWATKLRAKEIEVHPLIGAASLGTPEKLAAEAASLRKVAHWGMPDGRR
jgi:hypothetical protein